ncbi:MAG: glycosyltransferase family 4 protein [Novosphingobium sp.]|nr:glycosyltransferase family 4 protein [Novosphingobium sp.]
MSQEDCLNPARPAPPGTAQVITIRPPLASADRPRHVALIGTFAPRPCGIATFTTDIYEQLGRFHPEIRFDVYALENRADRAVDERVTQVIHADRREDYVRAAQRINTSGVEAVWLQHEYGIFGGNEGAYVLDFVDRLAPPLVLTLHTVIGQPSPLQRSILEHLIERASRIMVMSEHGRRLLIDMYGAPAEIIEVVAHGAPDRPFGRTEQFKQALGFAGKNVLMTFGLLGPGKGLEKAIEALPAIVAAQPDTVYRIVGATHPNLVALEGERYREGLQELAARIGVAEHIAWDNRFLETDELLDQIEACDIYLTPYLNLQQSTSGTLSYAVALGKAVVATPYIHARELLGDGTGKLIERKSSTAIAESVNQLLGDPAALTRMQRRAYAKGRTTIWPRFADATAALLRRAVAPAPQHVPLFATPPLEAVLAMSDGTGMLQHSIGIVPDRRHGYCLDDNARALMLMNVAERVPDAERARWQGVYASFIQHAWNPDHRRFRNFMAFDRSWCEELGSEDSNGRALWALGQTVECAADPDLRQWALRWFDIAHCSFEETAWPRSLALAMLGACALLRAQPDHAGARALVTRGAEVLGWLLAEARRPDWAWFEAVLGYDNPRLCQALIEAGEAMDRGDWTAEGLETLEWIAAQQVSVSGHFRPIGSETFHKPHTSLPFDQQPLEAQAAVEAAASAWRATGEARWFEHARTAYAWYFGANDRGAVLVDLATGRCRDGITPRGVNENCGAESILAFQLAHYSMLALARAQAGDSTGDGLEQAQRHVPQPAAHS